MARKIERTLRSGGWTLEGGYRRRATNTLALVERKYKEYKKEYPLRRLKSDQAAVRESKAPFEELQLLADATIVFASMAVESFLNLYGVRRLGENYYREHIERLPISVKLASILAACCDSLVDKEDEILKVLRRLFDRRNALVHPKTREIRPGRKTQDQTPSIPKAQSSVADMDRFFDLFCEFDEDARSWTQV